MKTRWLLAVGLALAFSDVALDARTPAEAPKSDDSATFKMHEVNVFDLLQEAQPDARASEEENLLRRFAHQSVYVPCTAEPNPEVKAYPKLKSDRPYYGTLVVDGNPIDRRDGKKYHFVVDESGESVAAVEKTAPAARDGGSPAGAPGPKADWTKRHYDRLYIDLNGDLDLTNDPVFRPMKSPPAGLVELFRQGVIGTCFDPVTIWRDYAPPIGRRSVRFIPKVILNGPRAAFLELTGDTQRRGNIRVATGDYTAVLEQDGYSVRCLWGRYDSPYMALRLVRKGATKLADAMYLPVGEMLDIDGQFYCFSSTPAGDALTVWPYRGDFGVFAIGAGGRKADKLAMRGLFLSDKGAYLVAPQQAWRDRLAERPREVRLPVGDYVIYVLDVELGDLLVGVTDLQMTGDDAPLLGPPKFPIRIRKGKPCVFQLVNKPEVVFSKPGKQIFKPGDDVQIEATLVDPVLGVRITDLNDKRRKVGERKVSGSDGKEIAVPRYASLDPTVVITSAPGAKIAEGKMPFG